MQANSHVPDTDAFVLINRQVEISRWRQMARLSVVRKWTSKALRFTIVSTQTISLERCLEDELPLHPAAVLYQIGQAKISEKQCNRSDGDWKC